MKGRRTHRCRIEGPAVPPDCRRSLPEADQRHRAERSRSSLPDDRRALLGNFRGRGPAAASAHAAMSGHGASRCGRASRRCGQMTGVGAVGLRYSPTTT